MALITPSPPLTFSLLCDESRLFIAQRTAGLLYFHKPKERKTESNTERHLSLLIILKYFAINAAIKQIMTIFNRAFSRIADNNVKQSLFIRLNLKFCEDFRTMLSRRHKNSLRKSDKREIQAQFLRVRQ